MCINYAGEIIINPGPGLYRSHGYYIIFFRSLSLTQIRKETLMLNLSREVRTLCWFMNSNMIKPENITISTLFITLQQLWAFYAAFNERVFHFTCIWRRVFLLKRCSLHNHFTILSNNQISHQELQTLKTIM